MWNDRKYLDMLSTLADCGYLRQFELADIVARGFADIGYEEFVVLPNNRICSLYTGQIVDLPTLDGKISVASSSFHFLVPTLQQLGNIFCRIGFENIKIESQLGSFWTASCEDRRGGGDQGILGAGERCKTPEEAIVSLLLQIL